jgi:hypothetical protein
LLLTGLLTAAAGGLLCCLGPPLLTGLGLASGGLSARQRRLDEDRRRGEELDRRLEVSLRRVHGKEAVVAALLAGRLTLPQAAALFRDLDETLPDPSVPRRLAAGGPADGERLCRQVLTWAGGRAPEGRTAPGQAADVVARLEAEFQQLRGRDGTVCLPD